LAGATEPVARLKTAFADTSAAIRQDSAATLAAFRADMQRMVAEHAISLRQARGFDIEYAAQRSAEERTSLEQALANDATSLAEKSATYGELLEMSARYQTQLAQDQRRFADAARQEAAKIALPYRQAFDDIG